MFCVWNSNNTNSDTHKKNKQLMLRMSVSVSHESLLIKSHICYNNRNVSNSPSTHSCSMSVSMAATLSPTERAPNTKSPMKRTFPQCLWMWQPRENRRAWNLARIHRGAFWPTAFPWICSRRVGEKRTVLLWPCFHLLYIKNESLHTYPQGQVT